MIINPVATAKLVGPRPPDPSHRRGTAGAPPRVRTAGVAPTSGLLFATGSGARVGRWSDTAWPITAAAA
jgi:hypothetical protein